MDLSSIFKAYDVRGVYPDEFDEVAAHRIGGAFARFAQAPTVVVGRDMRLSSDSLAGAFMEGVNGQGVDVVDVGLVSTDALYFASGRHQLPGAMFTASHNPSNYNGIKLCLAGAAPVGRGHGLEEVQGLAESGPTPAGRTGVVATRDIVSDFNEHVIGFVDVASFRPLKVAVDAANAMAGAMVPPLFAKLPVELIDIHFELDGSFPNHPPDPLQPDNLADLTALVQKEGADIGLAFDGDADRVFLVDEISQSISGSLTTAIVARRMLDVEGGASVIYNVICSRVVVETILAGGGKPLRGRVGHSFIKQLMASSGAVFGGEHSGHYYYRDNFRADSGLITSLIILETLSKSGGTMSDLVMPYRRYWNSGEINTEVADQTSKLQEVKRIHGDGRVDELDGLTVDYDDWWFNVRGSNTEPLLRLNVEHAEAAAGQRRTDEILEIIRG